MVVHDSIPMSTLCIRTYCHTNVAISTYLGGVGDFVDLLLFLGVGEGAEITGFGAFC